jgi:hypothetical protein
MKARRKHILKIRKPKILRRTTPRKDIAEVEEYTGMSLADLPAEVLEYILFYLIGLFSCHEIKPTPRTGKRTITPEESRLRSRDSGTTSILPSREYMSYPPLSRRIIMSSPSSLIQGNSLF